MKRILCGAIACFVTTTAFFAQDVITAAQAAQHVGDWKIYRRRPDQPWQLDHLPEDVTEERDLSAEEPARLAALATAWEKLNAEMVAPG